MSYLELGSTPCDEPCAQVGSPNYASHARAECARYINLLREAFGDEPEGARLAVKSFPHDFGTYYEVVCHYDEALPESLDYAFMLESDAPTTWEG